MQLNRLEGLSVAHTYDPELKKVTIRGAVTFPTELFNFADDIEVLDMSDGGLTDLPDDLGRLRRMRVAFFSCNPLTSVPKALANCRSLEMVGLKSCGISRFEEGALPLGLRGLILTDNKLAALPGFIGKLHALEKLMLAGNRLEVLPEEMAQCQRLELLRLPANELLVIPEWLWSLPKLAWYSDASNPVSHRLPIADTLPEISWKKLVIKDVIGKSAKNTVYRASLAGGQEVAVKLFGTDITTDGYPEDEMYANMAAGSHPRLIGIIGSLVDTPNKQPGLVMQLIPLGFKAPGLPPDLRTLTRDVFVPNQRFDLPVLTEILRNVCEALRHLHRHGIMHGDVYAHNALTNDRGLSFMGDLGAASFYDKEKDKCRRERLDVRGFGHLVEDLLSRLSPLQTADSQLILDKLAGLKGDCLSRELESVPSFDTVHDTLQELTYDVPG